MRLAIIGATGLVGKELCHILGESSLRPSVLLLAASPRTTGREVSCMGATHLIRTPEEVLADAPEIAIFSAGAAVSRTWAPRFLRAHCWVIDNSSAWRMDPQCPLVVPEVNAAALPAGKAAAPAIIANPNCATIQLAVALHPLHAHFGLQEVTLSTYQAVSGAGSAACQQFSAEEKGDVPERQSLPHPIYQNVIAQIGPLHEGHSEEERKIQQELRKILALPQLPVHVTCVRVPLLRGHSESVYIRTHTPLRVAKAVAVLRKQAGLVVHENSYPTPQEVAHSDLVHVGRLRQDHADTHGLHLWVVADNLRKGAATNALQIATQLLSPTPTR